MSLLINIPNELIINILIYLEEIQLLILINNIPFIKKLIMYHIKTFIKTYTNIYKFEQILWDNNNWIDCFKIKSLCNTNDYKLSLINEIFKYNNIILDLSNYTTNELYLLYKTIIKYPKLIIDDDLYTNINILITYNNDDLDILYNQMDILIKYNIHPIDAINIILLNQFYKYHNKN
jgi:hypothetical protein